MKKKLIHGPLNVLTYLVVKYDEFCREGWNLNFNGV